MRAPADAFERYVALGAGRSYARLGAMIGVSKRSIVKRASRERWQSRLREIETRVRAQSLARLQDDLATVLERQLKAVRIVQARAIETLKAKNLDTAADAVRALVAAQREERDIVGAAAGTTPVARAPLPAASSVAQQPTPDSRTPRPADRPANTEA